MNNSILNNIQPYKKLQLKHFFRFLKEYDVYEKYMYFIKMYFQYDKIIEYCYHNREYITYYNPMEYISSFSPSDFFKSIHMFRNDNNYADLKYVEILWLYEIRDSKEWYIDAVDKNFAIIKLKHKLCQI